MILLISNIYWWINLVFSLKIVPEQPSWVIDRVCVPYDYDHLILMSCIMVMPYKEIKEKCKEAVRKKGKYDPELVTWVWPTFENCQRKRL